MPPSRDAPAVRGMDVLFTNGNRELCLRLAHEDTGPHVSRPIVATAENPLNRHLRPGALGRSTKWKKCVYVPRFRQIPRPGEADRS